RHLSLHDALPIYSDGKPVVSEYVITIGGQKTLNEAAIGVEYLAMIEVHRFCCSRLQFWPKIRILYELAIYLKDALTIFCIYGEYIFQSDRKSTRLNSSHVKISYAVF